MGKGFKTDGARFSSPSCVYTRFFRLLRYARC
jgi:hypothetical protein